MANREDGYFHASVGAAILNEAGNVLAIRCKDVRGAVWQLPQWEIGFEESPSMRSGAQSRRKRGSNEVTPDSCTNRGTGLSANFPRRFAQARSAGAELSAGSCV
jgi:hypothetical protein